MIKICKEIDNIIIKYKSKKKSKINIKKYVIKEIKYIRT